MKVTKANFYDLLPSIKQEIQDADFLAIDCEFTGLLSSESISSLDLLEEYYEKTRNGSSRFLLLQFGLSIFRYIKNENVYENNSYSFYVFPHNNDAMFSSQISCINFLANCDFDFNTLFKDGIPYMTKETYQSKIEKFEQNALDNQSRNSVVPIPVDEQEYVNSTMKTIDSFLDSDDQSVKELVLEKTTPFRRKLVYQSVEAKYKNKIHLKLTSSDNDRVLVAQKTITAKDRELVRKQEFDEFMTRLHSDYGFSELIDHIVESRKLILGHNMLLDILHVINHFIFSPPNCLGEFKEFIKETFPNLIDTKVLSSSDDFKDVIKSTVLGDVVAVIQKEPFNIPEIRNSENFSLQMDNFHDAAFDSFCTGVCFLALGQFLIDKFKPNETNFTIDSSILAPFKNKIYVMKLKDFGFIDLKQNQKLKVNRNNVLFVTFPKEWNNAELYKLFQSYGTIEISWINSTSAYITLQNRDKVNAAFIHVSKNNACTVLRYKDYKSEKSTQTKTVSADLIRDKKRKAPQAAIHAEKMNKVARSDPSITNNMDKLVPMKAAPSSVFEENMNFEV